MFADELVTDRALGTLWPFADLAGAGCRRSVASAVGLMPENRDHGHAEISASSRLRGVDRDHARPSAARWVAGARPALRERRVRVATRGRGRSDLLPSK